MDDLDPHGPFAALVAEHQAVLRTFVRMLGVQPMWVDDVAQEVFLIAYRRFQDFDPSQGEFLAWLRGIARKVVANDRRREGARARRVNIDLAQLLTGDLGEHAEEVPVHGDLHEVLRSCLEHLPAHSRQLMRMRYEEDLDAERMGASLGRDGNAVRQALFRVREVLRRCMSTKLGSEAWS
jgi:RNA polymerase sigma-70 factor (ECF subfamily)